MVQCQAQKTPWRSKNVIPCLQQDGAIPYMKEGTIITIVDNGVVDHI